MLIKSQYLVTYCLTSLNCLICELTQDFFFIIKRLDIIYFSDRLWALKIMCLPYNGHLTIGTIALYTHNFTLTLSNIKRSSQPINFKNHLDWALCGIDLLPLTTYVFNSKVRQWSPSVNNMHPQLYKYLYKMPMWVHLKICILPKFFCMAQYLRLAGMIYYSLAAPLLRGWIHRRKIKREDRTIWQYNYTHNF